MEVYRCVVYMLGMCYCAVGESSDNNAAAAADGLRMLVSVCRDGRLHVCVEGCVCMCV